jgi:LysR family transcriptional regulator, nitrogen assimilation regulatory protein
MSLGGGSAIKLNQLRYFVKIVEAGSFSRAATMLYVAQPALSTQIAELEQEIGISLLLRSARGVRATPAGEALYHEARNVLQLFDRIPEIVRATESDVAGLVSLGMSSTLAAMVAGPFMKACKIALPNVSLSFISEDSISLRNRIQQGTLELAITFEAEPTAGLTRVELFHQHMFLLHTDESRRDRPEASLEEAAEYPLILPSQPNVVRRLLERAFAAAGVTPTVVAEIRDFSSGIAAVRSGVGACIMPIGNLEQVGSADTIIATPVGDDLYLTVCVVWANDTPLSRAAEAVRAEMLPFISRYIDERRPPGVRAIAADD